MKNNKIQDWLDFSYLTRSNQSYIETIYSDFIRDPSSIDSSWKNILYTLSKSHIKENLRENTIQYNDSSFSNIINSDIESVQTNHFLQQSNVFQLIHDFRTYGHLHAKLDPLNIYTPLQIPNLHPNFYNFTNTDLQKSFYVGSFSDNVDTMKLIDIYKKLENIYCNTIGIEYMHIVNNEERSWMQKNIEEHITYPLNFLHEEKKRFLTDLISAEKLEHYLSLKFPGAKRFSLEGCDVLIPMLKEIIYYSSKHNIQEIILGMSHRGRLNVLINIFGKKTKDLFNEFNDIYIDSQNMGDVKYHQGFTSYFITPERDIHLTLAFNPSHLEIINPVIMGSARARLDNLSNKNNNITILPIVLHGDAAVIGQGVTQETFNMSQTPAYNVNGTVHIIINNQIGFTISNPNEIRSTQYCTDIAKMIQAPIFHINADDLESVIFMTRIALEFRKKFKRDVVIDLICYRRHGHNEVDEPKITQPLMYQKIKTHPTLHTIYSNYLKKNNFITELDHQKIIEEYRKKLDQGQCVVTQCKEMNIKNIYQPQYTNNNNIYNQITIKHLQMLAHRINNIPVDIEIHPIVSKVYHNRMNMAQGHKLFDWGGAETLAYATLLDVGISIRLSGEDTTRGTFSHRHAIIHNQKNGFRYIPLMHLHTNQGIFFLWDSVLSEEATLAFEYGYSITQSNTLVIWEAQFGDFANGAQIVIDQFISSGESKWGQYCSLVMLLPHGYEGQGPEHSSARIERYLQLCAENNMQVCIPSTPAQLYHILRYQALHKIRKPLIIISPKSLLRHPLSISSLDTLIHGVFQPVIHEINNFSLSNIKRVIICSGKIYYDLLSQRNKNKQKNIAIIRIEQLYPFPVKEIQLVFTSYSHVQSFIWCQEEPENQGAWLYIQHCIHQTIEIKDNLRYIGRPISAAPSGGSFSIHQIQQKNLIHEALNI